MKFNVVGEGRFYGVFTANDQSEADAMVMRWANHHRLKSASATKVEPMIEWVEPRADSFMDHFRADAFAARQRMADALALQSQDWFRGVETVYGPIFDHSFNGVDRSHWSGLGNVTTHCGHGFWRNGVFVRPAQGGYRAQLRATLAHIRGAA
jgi:hypothetical protein